MQLDRCNFWYSSKSKSQNEAYFETVDWVWLSLEKHAWKRRMLSLRGVPEDKECMTTKGVVLRVWDLGIWKTSSHQITASFASNFKRWSQKTKANICSGWNLTRRKTHFSRKTFRRRVLQKIVGVSHTTHIPHISHTTHIPHISHTTHIPHISHTTHIPHISITPHISHTYPFKTYPTQYVSHQYVSVQHVSHQYVSMLCVSIQKVCISRNRKRIPPIHIPPIRIFNTYPTSTGPFNAYPFKKFASAGMAMSMSIIAYHFIPLLLGGNGNEYRNLAFPSILCKIINWI